jgi:hypothetical protein
MAGRHAAPPDEAFDQREREGAGSHRADVEVPLTPEEAAKPAPAKKPAAKKPVARAKAAPVKKAVAPVKKTTPPPSKKAGKS